MKRASVVLGLVGLLFAWAAYAQLKGPACPAGLVCITDADAAKIVSAFQQQQAAIEFLSRELEVAKAKSGCV